MSANLLVRILALTLAAATTLIGHSILDAKSEPRRPFYWTCQMGPYECKELKDPLMDEALRSTSGHYLWREYKAEGGNLELFAVTAPGYSAKEPPLCLRLQGWVVIRDEARNAQSATGSLPVREYVLASPLSEPMRRTIVAIGIWRWGEDKFINTYFGSRLYGLLDSTLWPRMSSIQIYTTLHGPYTDIDLNQEFLRLRGFLQHLPLHAE